MQAPLGRAKSGVVEAIKLVEMNGDELFPGPALQVADESGTNSYHVATATLLRRPERLADGQRVALERRGGKCLPVIVRGNRAIGLSASSHQSDYRCEKATQYKISSTALLSDNRPTIGRLLIDCPTDSEDDQFRSCSFRRQTFKQLLHLSDRNMDAKRGTFVSFLKTPHEHAPRRSKRARGRRCRRDWRRTDNRTSAYSTR